MARIIHETITANAVRLRRDRDGSVVNMLRLEGVERDPADENKSILSFQPPTIDGISEGFWNLEILENSIQDESGAAIQADTLYSFPVVKTTAPTTGSDLPIEHSPNTALRVEFFSESGYEIAPDEIELRIYVDGRWRHTYTSEFAAPGVVNIENQWEGISTVQAFGKYTNGESWFFEGLYFSRQLAAPIEHTVLTEDTTTTSTGLVITGVPDETPYDGQKFTVTLSAPAGRTIRHLSVDRQDIATNYEPLSGADQGFDVLTFPEYGSRYANAGVKTNHITVTYENWEKETAEYTFTVSPASTLVTYTKRNSAISYVNNETVLIAPGTNFLDITLTYVGGIGPQSVVPTLEGTSNPPITNMSLVRFWWAFTDGESKTRVAKIDTTLTDGTEVPITLYLTPVPIQPPGIIPQGSINGETKDLGDEVVWTIGHADPNKVNTSTYVEVKNLTTNQVRFSVGYGPAESVAGVTEFQHSVTTYGEFRVRVVYTYDDGSTETKDFFFSVIEPTPEPYESTLAVSPTSFYADEALTAFTWADHVHTVSHRAILITGPQEREIVLEATGGPMTTYLRNFTPGEYYLTHTAAFSDTEPPSSESQLLTFTVLAIPVNVQLQTVFAETGDKETTDYYDSLIAIANDPASTARQKTIANEVARTVGQLIALAGVNSPAITEARNNLNTYLAEQAGKENPLTPTEWATQQTQWENPEEQQQLRTEIVDAPTSSVDALLSHLNRQTHPLGSVAREIIGADWEFISKNAQSRGGGVPDDLLLADYRAYQDYARDADLVWPFEAWVYGEAPNA